MRRARATHSLGDVTAPFSIALLGDWSARAHRGHREPMLGVRQPVPIDRDNIDDVLGSLRPELRLGADRALHLRFTRLDDFHPDRLHELPLFDAVRALRRGAPRAVAAPQAPRATPAAGSLLDQIVGQSQARRPAPSPLEGGDLQSYLNSLVAPHVVAAADPRREALIAELDQVTTSGMRALLHHPEFQALEALWRGVAFLVQRIESDVDVRVHLIDVSREELGADQQAHPDAQSGDLYGLLTTPGAAFPETGWGALAGLYSFGPAPEDLRMLAWLGALARSLDAPLVSAGLPALAGCEAIEEESDPADWGIVPTAWQAARRQPEARWVGLVAPRFVLRAPYGRHSRRCDSFPFEELSVPGRRDEHLWGNPALACLALWVEAVGRFGQPARPGMSLEIEGLPRGEGEGEEEAVLGDRAVERLLEAGLMPLVSGAGADTLRLVRVQAVAEPPAPLAGRWFRA